MEHLARFRKSGRQAVRQRAQILMASVVYTPVAQIARICNTDEAYVRKVIHAFNAFGFESLNPKVGTGRPRTFEPATRERILAIALAPPSSLGEPLTRWSLRRLRGYLVRRRVGPRISLETIRSILAEAHASFQRTRSWKRSTDPQVEAKAARVLALYRQCPPGGVVVCFDEFGPISLQPYPGHCYARRKRPWRQRATYVRQRGVGYFFGAYDIHADLLFRWLPPGQDHHRGAGLLPVHPPALCRSPPYLPGQRQPLAALDTADPRLGRGAHRGTRRHADRRQLPEPHRMPLPAPARVRPQRR